MRVAPFVTCLVDTVTPQVGIATVQLLERLGREVVFRAEQTCCGQMHVKSGYPREVMPLSPQVRRHVLPGAGRRRRGRGGPFRLVHRLDAPPARGRGPCGRWTWVSEQPTRGQVSGLRRAGPSLRAPGDMPARIRAWFAERGQAAPGDDASLVRIIVESLATAYTDALRTAGELAGREVRRVHVVGGGSQNTLLCQAIADQCGLPVVAGPVEATTLGNVLVQARAAGAIRGRLAETRDLVRRTHDLQTYAPQTRSVRIMGR